MTTRATGWAFLGAGRHPRLWLAPALLAADGARAVGVWSRAAEHAREFAAMYGVQRTYLKLEDALADPEVEAVLVSTPNSLHAEHTLAALRAGKHVLVEKPMATSVADAGEMVRAAQAAGRVLGVGFHLRHNAVVRTARDRIRAGDIGDVQFLSAQFNLVSSPPPRLSLAHAAWKRDPEQMGGAGALMGLGVHVVDMVRFLTGGEIVAVSAVATGLSGGSPLESFAQVQLELDSGAQAHIVYGGSFPLSRNDAVVYGSRARLVLEDAIDVASHGALEVAVPEQIAPGMRLERWAPRVEDHYRVEIEGFTRAVQDGQRFEADGVDGLRVVEVATAIIDSQRQGGARVGVPRTHG